ncbi:hypothetical protein Tco_0837142 [Tanacetum coccineum]
MGEWPCGDDERRVRDVGGAMVDAAGRLANDEVRWVAWGGEDEGIVEEMLLILSWNGCAVVLFLEMWFNIEKVERKESPRRGFQLQESRADNVARDRGWGFVSIGTSRPEEGKRKSTGKRNCSFLGKSESGNVVERRKKSVRVKF